eukprot:9940832-Karenia_brevis.AAC.1
MSLPSFAPSANTHAYLSLSFEKNRIPTALHGVLNNMLHILRCAWPMEKEPISDFHHSKLTSQSFGPACHSRPTIGTGKFCKAIASNLRSTSMCLSFELS